MEQGDKRFNQAYDRISCYTDEKPVFFMSMFAFIFIIFMFDGQKQKFSSSSIILHQYCRCVSRHI